MHLPRQTTRVARNRWPAARSLRRCLRRAVTPLSPCHSWCARPPAHSRSPARSCPPVLSPFCLRTRARPRRALKPRAVLAQLCAMAYVLPVEMATALVELVRALLREEVQVSTVEFEGALRILLGVRIAACRASTRTPRAHPGDSWHPSCKAQHRQNSLCLRSCECHRLPYRVTWKSCRSLWGGWPFSPQR